MQRHLPLLMLCVLVLGAIARADAPPADTPDTLQKLYTDGNYKELIPKINKALALKGDAADAFKKYDLLMMKGDACLHTKSKSQAMDAFKSAAADATASAAKADAVTAAAAPSTDKPADASVALATAELIRVSSGNFTYTRKTKADKDDKPTPIDIIEPESRKLAFAALVTDMLARIKPKVDAAVKSNSLQQVAQAATDKDLVTLKAVEIAATGDSAQTQQMLGDLGGHAQTLMDGALDTMGTNMNSDVEAVKNRNKTAKAGEHITMMTIQQFITATNGIESNAQQIADYSTAMAAVFGTGTDFKAVTQKANELHDAAAKNLKTAKAAGY